MIKAREVARHPRKEGGSSLLLDRRRRHVQSVSDAADSALPPCCLLSFKATLAHSWKGELIRAQREREWQQVQTSTLLALPWGYRHSPRRQPLRHRHHRPILVEVHIEDVATPEPQTNNDSLAINSDIRPVTTATTGTENVASQTSSSSDFL